MRWLQHQNKSNVYDLNNAIHEASKTFRNKENKYLKAKIDETNRLKISETCKGASVTSRRVTSLELIQ